MTTEIASLPIGRKVIISNRFTYALTQENLTQKRVCELFSIPSPYGSLLKNQALFNKVPEKIWRRFNRWEESGDTLEEYAHEHRLMDCPPLVTKAEAAVSGNGETHQPTKDATTKPPKKEPVKPTLKLVDLRVTGMLPTRDMEVIQTRIDSLVKALEMRERDGQDTIIALNQHVGILQENGYTVKLSIKLNQKP